jgi:hypothetical protein
MMKFTSHESFAEPPDHALQRTGPRTVVASVAFAGRVGELGSSSPAI